MKKNLRSLLAILLLLVFSSGLFGDVAFAEGRVITDSHVDVEELFRIEKFLDSYSAENKVEIFFYAVSDGEKYGYADMEALKAAAMEDVYQKSVPDQALIVFFLDGKSGTASYFANEKASGLISEDGLRVIATHFTYPYFQKGEFLKGVENSLDLIDAVIRNREVKVFDFAEALTKEQKESLEKRIAEVQDQYDVDIVYLLDSHFSYDKEIKDFSADFYDYLGFGRGERKDGLLYVQDFAQRKFFTLGTGSCEKKFPSKLLDELQSGFVGNLKQNDFIGAYLNQVEDFESVLDGKYFSAGNTKTFVKGVGISILAAVGITVMAAFSQKVVTKKALANEYIVPGELVLTEDLDQYTHTTTTREKIEKDKGSGGSFSGSSGTSHSGSGGSY